MEFLIGGLIILTLVCLLTGPVLSLLALLTARNLQRRLRELERRAAPGVETEEAAKEEVGREEPVVAELPREEEPAGRERAAAERPFGWEAFLGRQALGWVAVVLLLFGVALCQATVQGRLATKAHRPAVLVGRNVSPSRTE